MGTDERVENENKRGIHFDFTPTSDTDKHLTFFKSYALMTLCLLPLINIFPLLYHIFGKQKSRTQTNMVIATTILSYPIAVYYIAIAYTIATLVGY